MSTETTHEDCLCLGCLTAPLVAENDRLRESLRRIEAMSRPLPVTRQGAIVSYGKAECGSLEDAAAIAREALGGN